MALWGGRFEQAPDELFKRLNDSLPFDWRLLPHDIAGSVAWAGAIHKAGVLTADEHQRLVRALHDLAEETAHDPRSIVADGDEDVHSWVERRLIEMVGPLGKKLHTGRSRNDQVATDLRLFVMAEIETRLAELRQARGALHRLAKREMGAVVAGYTHLQRAQPVLFSHWCLAYAEMLERDGERFGDALARAKRCPLGSGALAGTAYAIDRERLARELGFDGPTRNSLDGVSDRDFVLETLGAAAMCSLHLSRLAEDLIVYSSGEFAFVAMGDSVSSGSSLMPQKKNPDAMELLRGKAGRILGAWTALAVTLKGLPLAYNKDLQEDKEPLFDAMEHLSLCLRVVPIALDTLTVNRDACQRAAEGGYANATELADVLVEQGVPFREAHDQVGQVVRHAISKGVALEALPIGEIRRFAPKTPESVYERLRLDTLLAKRDVHGGTAPGRVAAALAEAEARLSAERA